MTFAILIGAAALLFSAGYILRSQRLDTLEFRAGRIRLVRDPAPASKKSSQPQKTKRNLNTHRRNTR
jgi:hypothetical protein